jgi:tetratricopeptide (TPR) repeat protein
LDDLKEIKTMMTEGKIVLDKAIINHDFEEALNIFTKAINKSNSSNQTSQTNQLHHLRGQCYFKLKQFEQAEKDFQEAILMSDDKSKLLFYSSLGKCKMQLALKDPVHVPPLSFSTKKPSNASKKFWNSATERMEKPSSTWESFTGRLRITQR